MSCFRLGGPMTVSVNAVEAVPEPPVAVMVTLPAVGCGHQRQAGRVGTRG